MTSFAMDMCKIFKGVKLVICRKLCRLLLLQEPLSLKTVIILVTIASSPNYMDDFFVVDQLLVNIQVSVTPL